MGIEGPGPYLADPCGRESCGHPANFHQPDPETGKMRCRKQISPAELPEGSEVRRLAASEGLVCGCPDFQQRPEHARRDKRWRQTMAAGALGGFETALAEAFDADVTDKTTPLIRRIRAIMQRAAVAGD